MAKRQNFVVGSTNPNTQTQTVTELNNAWDMFAVLRSGKLDGVFNAVSDYSNDASNEIANAILSITGSEPTGNSQDELAGALAQMRSDIETTSLTFKGYVGTSAPSTNDYVLIEGNIWINSATMPITFPIAASDIKQWNGSAWVNYGSTYTPADFDFFRNTEDNEGYYWFGGQWTIMSTDMSTTYFVLNQNTGKWEIKSSVNLPGSPTTTTPPAGDSSTKIATTEFVTTSSYRPDLFDVKWADHELDDMSWLRADTFSWQNGTTYSNAYQHLVDDIDGKTLTTEPMYSTGGYCWGTSSAHVYTNSATPAINDPVYGYGVGNNRVYCGYVTSVSSNSMTFYDTIATTSTTYPRNSSLDEIISYYQADDGHKICPESEESNVASIFTATGVAWYYILDTNNTRFKLPRTKFGFNGYRDGVGNYVAPSVPNASIKFATLVNGGDTGKHSGIISSISTSGYTVYSSGQLGVYQAVYEGSLNSGNSIYQNGSTVQPPATQMYLYFYVGQFGQAAIAETAGLNAELFNNKADTDFNNTDMIDYVIAQQTPTAGNNYTWYRKYKSGWVEMGGGPTAIAYQTNTTVTLPVTMADTNYTVVVSQCSVSSSYAEATLLGGTPVSTTQIRITSRASSTSQDNTQYYWEVKGVAAS